MFRRPLLLIACSAIPLISHAQSFTFALRGTGSMPTGEFADGNGSANGAILIGAKNGFGYGVDIGVAIKAIGLYAGFDRIKFDCDDARCTSNSTFTLQGVTTGLRVAPPLATRFAPYVQAGVTFNTLERTGGSSAGGALTTDRAPGYEVGAGALYTLGGLVALNPQVRYVGQNLTARVPGVTVTGGPSEAVNYLTFDLGLRVVTPFGQRR